MIYWRKKNNYQSCKKNKKKKKRRKKKKEKSLVFNLSEAINEVETNEKNKPVKNNNIIKKNINLSIFFHHS